MDEHVDSHFCNAQVSCVREFGKMFLKDTMAFSIDDKCKVPVGSPAIQKQQKVIKFLLFTFIRE